jgi:dihydrofolate reductase
MANLHVFNNVSLDGYFVDGRGDMSWAHTQDEEWNAFTSQNASGGGMLLFGRVTYEMMAGFWPSAQAMQMMPEVAEGMNAAQKVVFSRSLQRAEWQNTRLVKDDLVGEVRRMKNTLGQPDMVVLGSGSIVAQLAQENLIDSYQIVVHPLVLGSGRTLFEGVRQPLPLQLTHSRAFRNGNVVLSYTAVGS